MRLPCLPLTVAIAWATVWKMSQRKAYTIHCPKCGASQEVQLYDSINVVDDPELRDELFANRLNHVDCGACAFGFRVDKPLIYSDPAKNFLVFLNPLGRIPNHGDQKQFLDWMDNINSSLPDGVDAPAVHMVSSRTELIERIFLIEAGLDERVVEYIKHIIYTRNMVRVSPERKILLFDAQDSNDEKLCFVVQDAESRQLESMIEYSREAYDSLQAMFDQDDKTPSLMELFPGPYISARSLLIADQLA